MQIRTTSFLCILGILWGAASCGDDSDGKSDPNASSAGNGSGDHDPRAGTSGVPSSTDDSWVTTATPTQYVWGVWGTGPDDVWAVGSQNNILHWDGSAWKPSLSGTSGELRGVWGSSADDVWAVGDNGNYNGFGEILHWDGSEWAEIDAGSMEPLEGIWGSGPRDVWAVGATIAHWDGEAWSVDDRVEDVHNLWSSNGHAIWGSAADDVWVVGGSDNTEGFVLHWDGRAWEKALEGSSTLALFGLFAVWGSSANDVWALGWENIAHWDGTEWKIDDCSEDSWNIDVGASDLCPRGFRSMWGRTADDVWAVGSMGEYLSGFVEHWDGSSWTMVANGLTHGLTGVWGSGKNDVWAVGPMALQGGVILHHEK